MREASSRQLILKTPLARHMTVAVVRSVIYLEDALALVGVYESAGTLQLELFEEQG